MAPQSEPGPRAGGEVSHAIPELAASSAVAVLEVARDGRVAGANAALAELLGEPDAAGLAGRPLADLLAPGDSGALAAAAAADASRQGVEVRLAGSGGRTVVLRGDVLRIGSRGGERVTGVFTDCTELEELKVTLQHSARLEALASLTSGVAHDFNNLLTVLIGNLSLVAEELRDRPATFAKLKASRDAATRGSDLIAQLRGFAGAEELETSVLDPSEVVRKVVPLLGSVLGKRVRLKTKLDSGAGSVEANAAGLEAAIVNLAVNARDAIRGQGTVTVSSTALVLSQAEAAARQVAPGSYIEICVADDGPGIPEKLRERVFEAFFTTKRDRGGTGLGLSMVRSFARQLGGSAQIKGGDRGTVVALLLPVVAEPGETDATHTRPLATLPSGTERVAVLAADAGLAATVAQILGVLGYEVSVHGDVAELDGADAASWELLILDGALSGWAGGRERTARLRELNPDLRCLLLLDAASATEDAAPAAGAVLVKPFSLADLAARVRETLDG